MNELVKQPKQYMYKAKKVEDLTRDELIEAYKRVVDLHQEANEFHIRANKLQAELAEASCSIRWYRRFNG